MAATRSRGRLPLGFVAMSLDPLFDVIELGTEMTAESVVGDRIIVTARCAAIDEGLGNAEYGCDLVDVQVARVDGELKLLRRLLFVSGHASTSTTGK
jgi:hypothetical protein